MDYEHGSESSKHSRKDAEATRNKGDVLGPLFSLVNFEHENGTRKDIEISVNGSTLGPAKRSKSSHSGSSSSSDSIVEDFFQMDTKKLPKSRASHFASPKSHEDVPTPVKDDKSYVSSDASSKSEERYNWSPIASSSQLSDVTHESLLESFSPTQYPPIQVMERPGDFNPNRIPSSTFASKSSTPVDWSVTSTESLFSIRIGNNSFSRDHVLVSGGELHKSGELYKSGELNKTDELIRFRRPPAVVGGESEIECLDVEKSENVGKKSGVTEVSDESLEDTLKETVDNQIEVKLAPLGGSWNPPRVNRRFDESGLGTSSKSSAFPIKKKSAWHLCHCSNCSWARCKCKWISCCSCKWTSCCSCKRPSCCSCKWPSCCCRYPSCCCKWPSCCSCKWPSCCCSYPSCCCKWPSCHCKWPSCHCKWPRWPSCGFKWLSWPSCCCKWPSWPSCNCHCSNCSLSFCCCWNCKQKRICCCSSSS